MTPEISSLTVRAAMGAAKDLENAVKNLLRSIIDRATYYPTSNKYIITLSSEDFEALRGLVYGGSISVPGVAGLPGAQQGISHQTPAPRGHEDDDGRSS